MILTLKKAYNPGDTDPGRAYTHLHLELLVYNSGGFVVQVSYAYGSLDENKLFVPGKALGLQSISVEGEELSSLQSEMPKGGEPLLPGCLRIAYEHLQNRLGVEGALDYELPASPGDIKQEDKGEQDGETAK